MNESGDRSFLNVQKTAVFYILQEIIMLCYSLDKNVFFFVRLVKNWKSKNICDKIERNLFTWKTDRE